MLRLEESWDDDPNIALVPGDGRETMWIDPRLLYRLHDQTVDVFIEETTDDFSPAPDLRSADEKAATFHDEDDESQSFQVKNMESGERVPCIRFEKIGDGLYMSHPMGNGETVSLGKKSPSKKRKKAAST